MNLYAYVGNDPLNATDPSGECPMCVGALTSVAFGMAIRAATGEKVFDAKAVAADAVLGAVGAGIAGKAVQLARLSGTGLALTSKGLTATSKLSNAPTKGVYFLQKAGQKYVGQSKNLATRSAQSAANKGLQGAPGVRIGVVGGKASREVAEQGVLKNMGG